MRSWHKCALLATSKPPAAQYQALSKATKRFGPLQSGGIHFPLALRGALVKARVKLGKWGGVLQQAIDRLMRIRADGFPYLRLSLLLSSPQLPLQVCTEQVIIEQCEFVEVCL